MEACLCLCLQTCTLGLLQQVGSVLGALVFKGTMTEKQASTLVNSAARASAGPGGSTTLQRLTRNMWAAVGKQRAACGRAEEQAVEDKQTEARQLAELHQPRVHSPFLSQNKGLLIICLSVSLRVTHCLLQAVLRQPACCQVIAAVLYVYGLQPLRLPDDLWCSHLSCSCHFE